MIAEQPASPDDESWDELRPGWIWIAAILYAFYLAAFIYRTSFVIDDVRYFCLFDDMMISMQYASTLAAGDGLRWTDPGGYVEGYTNLAWVIYMAALHFVPISAAKISLLVQISGAVALLGCLWFVHRLSTAIGGASRFAHAGAIVLTALYMPLVNWSLQGTEVSVLALVTAAAAWMAVRVHKGELDLWWLTSLLAVGILVRLDMVVVYGSLVGVLLLLEPRRIPSRLLASGVPLVAVLVLMTGFRFFYYDSLLPNTYYLKMTGYPALLRITRGVYVLAAFVWSANPILIMGPFVWLAFRPRAELMLISAPVAAQFAYQAYVGGDAWEWWGSRYVTVVMPLYFVMLAHVLDALMRSLYQAVPQFAGQFRGHAHLIVAALYLFLVFNFNALTHPLNGLMKSLLITAPINVDVNRQEVEFAEIVRSITTTDAVVGVNLAGTLPYFADRPAVDLLGKSDLRIARTPARHLGEGVDRYISFHPGHEKWDSRYSVLELKPDLLTELPYDYIELKTELTDQYEHLRYHGRDFLVRRDSTRIDWERLRALTARG
jgi:arabinofuranosyltransferase